MVVRKEISNHASVTVVCEQSRGGGGSSRFLANPPHRNHLVNKQQCRQSKQACCNTLAPPNCTHHVRLRLAMVSALGSITIRAIRRGSQVGGNCSGGHGSRDVILPQGQAAERRSGRRRAAGQEAVKVESAHHDRLSQQTAMNRKTRRAQVVD